jgi:hypothetical protein
MTRSGSCAAEVAEHLVELVLRLVGERIGDGKERDQSLGHVWTLR